MKKLAYKSLYIVSVFVGATALVHAADMAAPSEQMVPTATEPVSIQVPTSFESFSTLNKSDLAAQGASASLGGVTFIQSINVAPADTRSKVAADVDLRLQANADALTALRAHSKELNADASARLAAAEADLKAKETALKASLSAAKASTIESWNSARGGLASDYQAYFTAVKQYESIYPSDFISMATLPASTTPTSVTSETRTADGKALDADGNEAADAHEGSPADRNESPANRSKLDDGSGSTSSANPQPGPNRAPTELQ